MKNEDIGKTILSICEQEVMPFIGDILLPHNTEDFNPNTKNCSACVLPMFGFG